ncbi:MAG: aminotransferase class I/II-fold pyridoxal phosphate-dependent enzyme [Bacteroidales bacterium]|nr:aminotransferase class I/II-fold pyridoxal phosphate-dependent enzyme [Bacteroidales bacterium]
MYQFQCDYNEGAHPRIMEKLLQTNLEQTVGYGEDHYCEEAREAIRKAVGRPDADVHFLVGGTQTNATVISSILRPYQGVLCASTGHINVHETGAIEHGGHKVLAVEARNGLLGSEQIRTAMQLHLAEDGPEHTVQPGMVYISFSSELGTVYSLRQLREIRAACREYGLPLFIDGARMGYGLASEGCDVTLQDIAELADVFYLGGTKQGALFGEAVVILNETLKKDFRYYIKQNGGMLAKGRLLGIQFLTLFEDGLYFEVSQHAVNQAMRIRDAFKAKGFEMLVQSPSNQQFPILDNVTLRRLSEKFLFSVWQKVDDEHTAVRFCTSWATRPEAVDALLAEL